MSRTSQLNRIPGRLLRQIALPAMLLGAPIAAPAAMAEDYVLDASHSQILFSYDHLGFSTSYGMFSGFEGEISFIEDDPAASQGQRVLSGALDADRLGGAVCAFHVGRLLRRRR